MATKEYRHRDGAYVVRTNHVPRRLVYGFELSKNQKAEHDYLTDEEITTRQFFIYRGEAFLVSDVMMGGTYLNQCNDNPVLLDGWLLMLPDSYFSGITVKFVDVDNEEFVVVGSYYTKSCCD